MARFSEEELDEIRRNTDIVTLIESYGTKLKARPTPNEYVGQCPLHDDKDPSLHVNRAKGVWQCKGCGKEGDCFDWVQCAEKVSFPHSVELLKAKAVGVLAGNGAKAQFARRLESPIAATAEDHEQLFQVAKAILSASEADKVIDQPNVNDACGLRDRAMLELLYSCGIRRRELAELKLYSFDRDRKTLMITQGKGKKDRVVPVGQRALDWIERYLEEGRPKLVVDPNEQTLFLSTLGQQLEPDSLTEYVRRYVESAEIGKKGSCHMFRHTMATLMLENGADIRYIQAMLGHADLRTTQIYTQVSIRKLQQIHKLTHPADLPPTVPEPEPETPQTDPAKETPSDSDPK